MPGKHVHFRDATPSPSYSVSSLPSSPGPLTPPPINTYGSRYTYAPLPHIPVQMHPVLASVPAPALTWDVSTHPKHAVPSNPTMPDRVLFDYATTPPMPMLYVICAELPWTLNIVSRKGPGLTVAEMLEELHACLRRPVTAEELRSARDQKMVLRAFAKRVSRIADPISAEKEKAKGVMRVDFLGDKTRYLGLSSTGKGPDYWMLNVSR